ncbi:MAG: DUF883 domain-containing protein [Rhodocyclaceae bacterium]
MASIKDKVVDGGQSVLDEAEAVMQEAESLLANVGEKGEAAMARVAERLKVAREKLVEFERVAVAKTKEAAVATDEYVHENPWKSIGLAAAVGVVVGILIGRK